MTGSQAVPSAWGTLIGLLSGLPLQPETVSGITNLCDCCQQCTTGNLCVAFGIVGGTCQIFEDLLPGFCPEGPGFVAGANTDPLYGGGCGAGLAWYQFT